MKISIPNLLFKTHLSQSRHKYRKVVYSNAWLQHTYCHYFSPHRVMFTLVTDIYENFLEGYKLSSLHSLGYWHSEEPCLEWYFSQSFLRLKINQLYLRSVMCNIWAGISVSAACDVRSARITSFFIKHSVINVRDIVFPTDGSLPI